VKTKLGSLAQVFVAMVAMLVSAIGQVPQNMALVPASSFQMGDSLDGIYPTELPTHTVYVSDFYVDKYEVSGKLWNEVYSWAISRGYDFYNSGSYREENHPVQTVRWYDAAKWCNARSEMEGLVPAYYTDPTKVAVYRTGFQNIKNDWVSWDKGYRLPTEAEWEKAARGGLNGKRFPLGDTITHLQANYYSSDAYSYDISTTRQYHPTYNRSYNNSGFPFTSPIGSFEPNGYGLYDMAGNVWEWCWDKYDPSYYSSSPEHNPLGTDSGYDVVVRSGSWANDAKSCRSSDREVWSIVSAYNFVGFRTVLPATLPETPAPIKLIEEPRVRPVYGACPDRLPGKTNLVIATHGWNSDGKWVDDMTNAITTYLITNGLNDWQVHAHKWVEKAQTSALISFIGAEIVLRRGRDEGNNLGNRLKDQGWKHIHFIGHSAGAALIQSAAEIVKADDITVTIHTTFLDPYVGLTYGGRSKYGAGSDWSDHYFSLDSDTFDILSGLTGGHLTYSYNVDVTWLDPNKFSRGTYRSSWDGNVEECYRTVTSHGWAYKFYTETITGSLPQSDTKDFGFPMSKEGEWDFTTSQYPNGNDPPFYLGTPDPSCVPDIRIPPPDISPFQDFFKLQLVQNSTGSKEVTGTGLTLTSGSPAWIAAMVPITNSVNFITFEAKFLSTEAEGLLTVYWDTNVLGSIDERVALPSLRQYTFPLPETTTAGTKMLGFRLDAFSQTRSSVTITNTAFGFGGIKQPFALTVTGNRFNGSPVFQLTGPVGFNYTVESSSNLSNWTAFATLVNTNGIVRFIDSTSTNATARFYRAVVH